MQNVSFFGYVHKIVRLWKEADRSYIPAEAELNIEGRIKMKIKKTNSEWQAELAPEAYRVTRKGATERAFSHPYAMAKEAGVYHCICCDAPLFASGAKYDSGSGWPSYYAPVSENAVSEHADRQLPGVRTEVRCADCGAHLGHVFDDGPEPTNLRYCINGTALDLKIEGER